MADIAGRLFVITGGPGSGKTTLVDALGQRGYLTSVEAGRAIIRDQVKRGGSSLPWSNPAAFAELMLSHELHWYRKAQETTAVWFFDRGIPDVVGFLRLMSLAVPPHVDEAVRACRYGTRVFVAPPWSDIFHHDVERKQTLEEGVRTYDAMVAVYAGCGYHLVMLPLAPVNERLEFVLDTVHARA